MIVGAIGYWAFDNAVLYATFPAFGFEPALMVVLLGYLIGQLGGLLPIPGGIGGIDGGLIGTLIVYGAPAAVAAAAVLAYRMILFWLPLLLGAVAFFQLLRDMPKDGELSIRGSERAGGLGRELTAYQDPRSIRGGSVVACTTIDTGDAGRLAGENCVCTPLVDGNAGERSSRARDQSARGNGDRSWGPKRSQPRSTSISATLKPRVGAETHVPCRPPQGRPRGQRCGAPVTPIEDDSANLPAGHEARRAGCRGDTARYPASDRRWAGRTAPRTAARRAEHRRRNARA